MSASFSAIEALLDCIYPSRCPLCGRLGASPCEPCRSEMAVHEPGVEFGGFPPLEYRACLFRYQGRAAEAVQGLKYDRCTSMASWMAAQLCAAPARLGLEYDVVAPVPIHWTRRTERGFNQSELLAEGLSPRLDLLGRNRRTKPQVGLSRVERLKNLEGAFEASPKVSGMRVLLIDDVLTSGQTARECAKALLGAGAREVGILTFAGDTFS